MIKRLIGRFRHGDDSGVSLVEVMIAMALFSLVIVAVDSSLTVVQERQVQVTNGVEALDNVQLAQETITRDIESSMSWTTPAVPTSAPGSPITVSWTGANSGMVFTSELNEALATITVALNTTTHMLTITCADVSSDSACGGSAGGTQTQVAVANVDSSSSFTFTTDQITTTVNSISSSQFFFTDIASVLTLDTPRVGAPHVSKTTITSPSIIPYNQVYACQTDAAAEGGNGSC
jgi:prepilin-type N-terminal cleavage/methylation domain-containing protein